MLYPLLCNRVKWDNGIIKDVRNNLTTQRNGENQMRTSYPKTVETMERITRQYLCDHFDETVEGVDTILSGWCLEVVVKW